MSVHYRYSPERHDPVEFILTGNRLVCVDGDPEWTPHVRFLIDVSSNMPGGVEEDYEMRVVRGLIEDGEPVEIIQHTPTRKPWEIR